MITTINPHSEMDAVMIGDEDEEEDKQPSPTKPDVFSRLSSLNNSTRARDAKHSFFGARRSSETPRQSSPAREEFGQSENSD